MSIFPLVPLTEMADIHDYLREPISQTARNKREGPYPYFGATGQVGWIDGYRQDGKYVLLGEDGAPFLAACRT
jgi:type I restriction enzyme S subunit